MKKYIILLVFICFVTNLFSQFSESFEGELFPPTSWVSFNNGIGLNFDWQLSNNAFIGDNAAYVRYEDVDSGLAEDWLVTSQFTPTANAHTFSFYQKKEYEIEYFTEYTIRVSTTSQDSPSDFIIIDIQYESDLNLFYSLHEIDLSEYIDREIYIAFVMINDNGDNWFIDEVALPNCPTPIDLFASNFTSSGVDLTWKDDVSSSWDVEIVKSGNQPTGNPQFVGLSNNNFTWSGGESLTEYDFYVRSVCSDNSYSSLAGPYRFQTICSNETCDYQFVFSDTYGDDWNGAYIEIKQNGISIGTLTLTERSFGPFIVNFSLCTDVDFELIWHSGNWDQECIFEFYDIWNQLYYSFDAGESPENNEVFYSSVANCSPVTCRFPYDLIATDFTTNGATISWTEKDSASIWDIEIVEFGNPPTGIPTEINRTSNPFFWNGGSPGTYYNVYVRAVCNVDDFSSWSQKPFTFTTLCDNVIADFPFNENFKAEVLLPSCWTSINKYNEFNAWKTVSDTYTEDSIVICKNKKINQDIWLISPEFDFSKMLTYPILSFDWKMSYYWMVYPYDNGNLNVRISIDGGAKWSEPIWSEELAGEFLSFDWKSTNIDLEKYMHESSVLIAFQYIAKDASSVYLDNFKIEENDGTITKISSVETDNLIIYPIPAKDRIFINYYDLTGTITKIKIINLIGKTVYSENYNSKVGDNQMSIGISTLSTGVYFIVLDTINGVIIKKMVKD